VLDPYFSATKIEWLLANVDGLADRARDGRAVFGTIDAWLIFKLTGELATDPSNASRTLLFRHIRRGAWDGELLDLFRACPSGRCPRWAASSGAIGVTRAEALHGHEVPVAGGRGRPASGAVRTGRHRSGARQEHVRDGVVRSPERGFRGA